MLAVIAGQGRLPAVLANAQAGTQAGTQAGAPLVCALEGFLPEGVDPNIVFRIETLGTLLQTLQQRGVRDVCLAGAIRRPPVDPSRIDAATLPLVPVLMQAIGQGDDAALRAVIGIFEQAGFRVVGAHDIQPDLVPQPGVLGTVQPGDRESRDADRGAAVLAALSAADMGQSCVVQAGQVLAVEGSYGTDWMLQSLRHRPDGGQGGVFVKAPKLDQDIRVDMPAIGPDTVVGAHAAGLRGLVIEAGGVMILDRDAVVAACDEAGLFLWVRPREEACAPS